MSHVNFLLRGERTKKPFPYTGCGLQGIFLLNGYATRRHEGESYVSVTDVDGLHKAIGRHLVMHRKVLAPEEVRFLRKTLGLTQAELAAKLGNTVQSVARWEKAQCDMPATADKLLRAIYLAENVSDESDLDTIRKLLVNVLDELDSRDEGDAPQASFQFEEKWEPSLMA